MKKILLIAIFIIIFCFSACSKKEEVTTKQISLQIGTYTLEDAKEGFPVPYITLKENQEFIFEYSPLSSTIPIGSYERKEDNLILTNNSEKGEQYYFKIEEGKLVFQKEQSYELPIFARETIYDGVVFVFQEEQEEK